MLSKNNANVYYYKLPSGLNFSKKTYISYKLENYEDGEYKNSIMLTVFITGALNNYDLERQAIIVDKDLNKAILTNARILRQNIWLTDLIDNEEKTKSIILQYYINVYE